MANKNVNIKNRQNKMRDKNVKTKSPTSLRDKKAKASKAGNNFVKAFAGIVIIVIVAGGLLGFYNQVETGKNLMTQINEIGKSVGDKITSIMKGDTSEEDKYIDITKDGIYLEGKQPPKEGSIPPAK